MKARRRSPNDLDRPRDEDDLVNEAGKESFPASDPPAFAQSGPRSTTPSSEAPARQEPNSAQVRGAMKSGRTMGKTSAEDPAAAPFDTDQEAAGTVPNRPALVLEMEREKREAARKSPVLPATMRIAIIAVLALIALWIAFS
jgi:hypothetical protein